MTDEKEKSEGFKTYTTRYMHPDLHRQWKIAAASRGITMEAYLNVALSAQINVDLEELRKREDERIERR